MGHVILMRNLSNVINKQNRVNVVLLPGWFDPNSGWQDLAPKGVDIYEYGRPKKNPKILDKLVKIKEVDHVVAIHPYYDMVEHQMDWLETAEYIRNILKSNNIEPPYILICHSAGYRIGHVFCDQYSSEVKGMIVIDGSHRVPKKYLGLTTYGPKDGDDPLYRSFKERLVENYDQISYPCKFTKRVVVFCVLDQDDSKDDLFGGKLGDPVEYFRKITDRNDESELLLVEKKGHFIHHSQPSLIIKLTKKMLAL